MITEGTELHLVNVSNQHEYENINEMLIWDFNFNPLSQQEIAKFTPNIWHRYARKVSHPLGVSMERVSHEEEDMEEP